MADTLVDESGQEYEVVNDTGDGGWLNSVFGAVQSGVSAVGSYLSSLPKGQSTSQGAGSGQASSTPSQSSVWSNLLSGLQNAAMQIPAVKNLVSSGAQSTAQQQAGAFIMNPITWVLAGVAFIFLIIAIAKK